MKRLCLAQAKLLMKDRITSPKSPQLQALRSRRKWSILANGRKCTAGEQRINLEFPLLKLTQMLAIHNLRQASILTR
ncbi:hypothetical protein AD933_09250 [Acetobacter malorum]|uniref:Uncharacterized protein n=1 Tax=Acetobacter malorum TaxID=178901 RepID=A0A149RMK6_9PROT|nr:hypothetical protein AD933_09250 [Acetobacter malorum]